MLSPITKTLLSVAGFMAATAANLILAGVWVGWSRSAWADCPNYAFALPWYPEPPLPVITLSGTLAVLGVACFAARLFGTERLSPAQKIVSIAGMTLSGLPLVAAVLLPTASDGLHLTGSGC